MKKTEREQILNKWREAYRLANKKEPPLIQSEGGWLRVGMSSIRISDVPTMTQRLLDRVKNEPQ